MLFSGLFCSAYKQILAGLRFDFIIHNHHDNVLLSRGGGGEQDWPILGLPSFSMNGVQITYLFLCEHQNCSGLLGNVKS
eukprot:scaffold63107_cov81-Cyclotella_meneghiniana.AAC.7